MPTTMSAAEEHMKAAEKALQTSLFKWSKDHFLAATEYDRAGKEFFTKGQYEKSVEAHFLSAQQRQANDDPFQAARSYEESMRISGDKLQKTKEALGFLLNAENLYKQCNKEEPSCRLALRRIDMMVKANEARPGTFTSDDLRKSFTAAIDTHELFEKWHSMIEVFTKQTNFLMKELVEGRAKTQEIYKVIDLQMETQDKLKQAKQKELLTKIVICLYFDRDLIRVNLFLEESYNFKSVSNAGPDFVGLGFSLYEAYQNGDEEQLNRTKQSSLFQFLPLEVARVVRLLKLDMGVGKTDEFGNPLGVIVPVTAEPTQTIHEFTGGATLQSTENPNLPTDLDDDLGLA